MTRKMLARDDHSGMNRIEFQTCSPKSAIRPVRHLPSPVIMKNVDLMQVPTCCQHVGISFEARGRDSFFAASDMSFKLACNRWPRLNSCASRRILDAS